MLCFIALKKMIVQMILQMKFVLFTGVMLLLRSSIIGLRDLEMAILIRKSQQLSSNDEDGFYQGYTR